VQIIVDIEHWEAGRPSGTVRSAHGVVGRSFSGNLEFIAMVERLYQAESDMSRPQDKTNERDKS
jgi:hypothetical protein